MAHGSPGPLSSRTVGFPESGWRRRLSPKDLPVFPVVYLYQLRPARLYSMAKAAFAL